MIFKVASKQPVVYPPGYFGDGMESHIPSSPEMDKEELEYQEQTYDDFNIGRFEENGPEEDTFPGNYDEGDFDIPPEPEVSNHTLYRLYDVFIHKSAEPFASQQLYLMHDFQYGSNEEILVVPNRFAVVAILNVRFFNSSYNLPMATLL